MANAKLAAGQAGQFSGRVSFNEGQGDLPMLQVTTPWSTAEIYLHGAHVTRFKKTGDAPLLFMSQCSRFEDGQPIRGGIPVIFPWFGSREGLWMHGFARTHDWELKEFALAADGGVRLRFSLPEYPEAASFPSFKAEYAVTVAQDLTLELAVTNTSGEDFVFEDCLHTYFEVGDVTAIGISGLKGVAYLDKTANFAQKQETADQIRISSEVDRVFLNTKSTVEIHDPRLSRKVVVEKHNSDSTVVWNPWIAKSQQMPDFGNDEYQHMVCVESGNVGENQIKLEPGKSSTLVVRLSTVPLA
jgi:D-hexose-6-phosphate mutarotase